MAEACIPNAGISRARCCATSAKAGNRMLSASHPSSPKFAGVETTRGLLSGVRALAMNLERSPQSHWRGGRADCISTVNSELRAQCRRAAQASDQQAARLRQNGQTRNSVLLGLLGRSLTFNLGQGMKHHRTRRSDTGKGFDGVHDP